VQSEEMAMKLVFLNKRVYTNVQRYDFEAFPTLNNHSLMIVPVCE